MQKAFGYFLLLLMIGLLWAQQKTPPTRHLAFTAKNGNVAFDHEAHVKREKGSCSVCHPALFPQDAKAPVRFKPPHKAEETKKTSCGFCHRTGGTAFGTQGNCTNSKCHVRAAAKKK